MSDIHAQLRLSFATLVPRISSLVMLGFVAAAVFSAFAVDMPLMLLGLCVGAMWLSGLALLWFGLYLVLSGVVGALSLLCGVVRLAGEHLQRTLLAGRQRHR